MRQAFMLFTLAHAVGFYWLSSFRSDRKLWRLVVEILLYTVAVALVFAPVLDGNNYLYALVLVVFHLIVAPVDYFAMRHISSAKARAVLFFAIELFTLAGFAVMAFFHAVRWGAFEPWREVRFLLSSLDLDYSQVLAWAFALAIALRPAGVLIRKILDAVEIWKDEGAQPGDGGSGEGADEVADTLAQRHLSGAAVGCIERLCLLAAAFLGSWTAFGLVMVSKAVLFCLAVRKDPSWGMRVYVGSLLSAFTVLVLVAVAKPFF